jgi:DNA-binding IclR family transcriptional regulator
VATPKTRSVVKAFAILNSLKAGNEWPTSAELSRRAQLPEASGYRLIQTLEELGAVVRDRRGRYRPGMLLVSLSEGLTSEDLLREASYPILRELSARLGMTVHVGVLEEGMVTYVAKVDEFGRDAVLTKVGSQLEAYCTGLGKVLLAELPPNEFEAFLAEGDLIPLTEWTITDPIVLRREIAAIRSRQYAIDDREIVPDLRCVAVPIRGADGITIAALSASDIYTRMDPARQEELRAILHDAAGTIARKLYPCGLSLVRDRHFVPRIRRRTAVRA